jgi:hypothetical protein
MSYVLGIFTLSPIHIRTPETNLGYDVRIYTINLSSYGTQDQNCYGKTWP